MHMQLSAAANQMHAELIGEDVAFSHVGTDTRALQQGDLFVALQGENFDGHDCLLKAQQAGAVAAMVSRFEPSALPLLKVKDTRSGLGQLASIWRHQFNLPVAGVTGSNGKTTVKEMLASIMGRKGQVLATQGNLNNDIGVPLTLLRMQDDHRFAVIEMGANHAGEIKYLCSLAKPHVVVITNAAAAHLEGFGSIEGVAKAKGEIFSSLDKDGIAVINVDDPFASLWQDLARGKKIISFGLSQDADVSADWVQSAAFIQMEIQTLSGSCQVHMQVVGRHNVMNALAATAVAQAMGASLEMVRDGLEAFKPVAGRLQLQSGLHGMQILNDTYNANPASFKSAVDVLVEMPGKKWLVLGDMGELGDGAEQIHFDCGKLAKDSGVEYLYAIGELSQHAVKAFGDKAAWFANKGDLARQLKQDWNDSSNGTLLIKGSRLMHMEEVIKALQAGGDQ